MTAAIASLLFFTMSVAAEVFFARDVLHTGAAGYGLLMTAWTLGMVAGAVGLARRVPRAWLAAGALAGVALQGAGLLGAALGATMARRSSRSSSAASRTASRTCCCAR